MSSPTDQEELDDIRNYHESLRYSVDSDMLDKSESLSLSTDGPDLEFIFEDETGEKFYYENAPPVSQTKDRRREIFAKYKKSQPVVVPVEKTDFLNSFDEIFQIEGGKSSGDKTRFMKKSRVEETVEPPKESSQTEISLPVFVLEQSRAKSERSDSIGNSSARSSVETYNPQPKESIDTQISQNELSVNLKNEEQLRPVTPNKNPIKVSFSYAQDDGKKRVSEKIIEPIPIQNEVRVLVSEKAIDPISMESSRSESIQIEQYASNDDLLNKPFFEEEQRVAKFLRKAKKMNSIYPNFRNPLTNMEIESKYLQVLAITFEEALIILQSITLKVFYFLNQPKPFQKEMTNLNYFTNSGWEKNKDVPEIHLIKPNIKFASTPINEKKLFEAMKNYREVTTYYKTYTVKKMNTEEGIANYFRLREKFWRLEQNIRSISEDVYRASLGIGFPHFYYEYLNVLKSPHPTKAENRIAQHHKIILSTLIQNKQRGEPLSCSQVGAAVKMKLQRQLKFLHPF